MAPTSAAILTSAPILLSPAAASRGAPQGAQDPRRAAVDVREPQDGHVQDVAGAGAGGLDDCLEDDGGVAVALRHIDDHVDLVGGDGVREELGVGGFAFHGRDFQGGQDLGFIGVARGAEDGVVAGPQKGVVQGLAQVAIASQDENARHDYIL